MSPSVTCSSSHTHSSRSKFYLAVGVSALLSTQAFAVAVPIANASFEGPNALGQVALPDIDSWTDTLPPQGNQVTGVYYNYPTLENGSPSPDYHPNMDGNQAAYIFMAPGAGIFQDLAAPAAKFTIGQSYRFTVGIIGDGGDMPDGTTMRISLYYRDALNTMQKVGFTDIVNSHALFPDRVNFRDFTFNIPTVATSDAWANKQIGILFAAQTALGGYYDVDNVRLEAIPEPASAWLLGAGLAMWGGLRRRRHGRA